jgi:hypothetical protein
MGDAASGGMSGMDTSSGGGGSMDLSSLGSSFSIASAGLKVGGDMFSAMGTANADTFKAETLDQAAQYGELKAVQTNAQMTRNLSITLGNIDAVRAAARSDPTSPTGAAVRDYADQVGTNQKNIKVDSIMAQAQEDEAQAAYMRSASSSALLGGGIKGAGDLLSAAAPLLLL